MVHLDRGVVVAEVHDTSAFIAEIRLPASSPLAELAVGDKVTLRAAGAPNDEMECQIARIRDRVEARDAAARQDRGVDDPEAIMLTTTPFGMTHGKSGMAGHARLYGRRHTLAYAKLYVPLQRVVRVSLWALM